jgi:hypothetical protein
MWIEESHGYVKLLARAHRFERGGKTLQMRGNRMTRLGAVVYECGTGQGMEGNAMKQGQDVLSFHVHKEKLFKRGKDKIIVGATWRRRASNRCTEVTPHITHFRYRYLCQTKS